MRDLDLPSIVQIQPRRYRLNWWKVGALAFCLGFWSLAVAFGIFLTSAR